MPAPPSTKKRSTQFLAMQYLDTRKLKRYLDEHHKKDNYKLATQNDFYFIETDTPLSNQELDKIRNAAKVDAVPRSLSPSPGSLLIPTRPRSRANSLSGREGLYQPPPRTGTDSSRRTTTKPFSLRTLGKLGLIKIRLSQGLKQRLADKADDQQEVNQNEDRE